jgi:hypothetical protein
MQSYILISEISFWYLINYTKFFEHSNYTKLYNNIEKKSTKTAADILLLQPTYIKEIPLN